MLTAPHREYFAQRTFRILSTEATITGWLLGALAKLQKAIINFVLSVCLSVILSVH